MDQRPDDQRPDDQQLDDLQPEDRRPDDRRPDDRRPDEPRPHEPGRDPVADRDGPPAPPVWVAPDATPDLAPAAGGGSPGQPTSGDAVDAGVPSAVTASRGRGRRVGAVVVVSAVLVAAALGVAVIVGGEDADDGSAVDAGEAGEDAADPNDPGSGEGSAAAPDQDGAEDPGTDEPGAADPDADDPGADDPDADEPGTADPDADEPGDAPDRGADREVELPPVDAADELDRPDLDVLSGSDAAFAEVLLDVDASERTMIRYQQGIVAALLEGAPDDPSDLLDELSAVANTAANELLTIRDRLEADVDDPGAREVRDRYVEHLDTWVVFMRAVQERPGLLGPNADTDRFTLAINLSADAFARSVAERLPADADAEVSRFADEVLERGFRSEQDAQV